MSISFVPDAAGTKGIIQINGVDKLEINDSGAIIALDPIAHNEATENRLLQSGDFGLGGRAHEISSTDLDDLMVTGFYRGYSLTNAPEGSTDWFFIEVIDHGGTGWTYQKAVSFFQLSDTWERIQDDGTWGPWVRKYNQYNILDTVSQSGGIPTGGIFERGSNANGDYIKYADGTLTCLKKITTNNVNTHVIVTSVLHGSDAYVGTWPATFTAPSTISAVAIPAVDESLAVWPSCYGQASTISCGAWRAIASEGISTTTVIHLIGIGKWF